jgi:hypothetical protein
MEHNLIVGIIPWPVAFVTAGWFAVMALKARKNAALWAIGGGVLGLIVSTIILGLAQAVFIPMADNEVTPYRIKMAFVAILVVFVLGWLFAGSIHPHFLALWKRRTEPSATEQPAKTSADIRKQP